MANFIYSALDAKGEQTNGSVVAATEAEAVQKLRSQGLYPTQISEEGKGKTLASKSPAKKAKGRNVNITIGKGGKTGG
ncbi:MAG: hypothetical protein H7Y36_09755 [Armatimonadetes bacterium]|nr:hypothetical protein [Akkermansiaceae bacterium]